MLRKRHKITNTSPHFTQLFHHFDLSDAESSNSTDSIIKPEPHHPYPATKTHVSLLPSCFHFFSFSPNSSSSSFPTSTTSLDKPTDHRASSLPGTDLSLVFKYVSSDLRRRSVSALVNVLVIVLVVAFCVVLQVSFSKSDLLFLSLSENTAGDADMVVMKDMGWPGRDAFEYWAKQWEDVEAIQWRRWAQGYRTDDKEWSVVDLRLDPREETPFLDHVTIKRLLNEWKEQQRQQRQLQSHKKEASVGVVRTNKKNVRQVQHMQDDDKTTPVSASENVTPITVSREQIRDELTQRQIQDDSNRQHMRDDATRQQIWDDLTQRHMQDDMNVIFKFLNKLCGLAPRWMFLGVVYAKNTSTVTKTVDSSPLNQGDTNSDGRTAVLLAWDQHLEADIQIGRKWKSRRAGLLEAHISSSILDQLAVRPNYGDRVQFSMDLFQIFNPTANGNNPTYASMLQFLGIDDQQQNKTLTVPLNLQNPFLQESLKYMGAVLILQVYVDQDNNVTITPRFTTNNLGSIINDTNLAQMFPQQGIFVNIGQAFAQAQQQFGDTFGNQLDYTLGDQLDQQMNGPSNATTTTNQLRNNSTFSSINETVVFNFTDGTLTYSASVVAILLPIAATAGSQTAVEFTVVDAIHAPKGKWNSILGETFDIDAQFLTQTLVSYMQEFVDGLNFDAFGPLASFVPTVVRSLVDPVLESYSNGSRSFSDSAPILQIQHNQRQDLYLGSTSASIRKFSEFTDGLGVLVGLDFPLNITTPLKDAFDSTLLLRVFLDVVFLIIFLLIAFLGGVLIYSISLSDVDERTYEFGMLRALGLRHKSLMGILVTRSVAAAIPGFCIGLGLSAITLIFVAIALSNMSEFYVDGTLTFSSIIAAMVIGLLVPFFCNIVPTRRALSRTLKESMDTTSVAEGSTVIQQTKLASFKLNWSQIGIGFLLLAAGIIFYYLLPAAFLDEEYFTFYFIMNFALMGMLLGLCVLAQVLQPWIEIVVLKILIPFFYKKGDTPIASTVQSCLYTHRRRNRNAALMFSISVSFVIFSGVLIEQQVYGVSSITETIFGADIVANALSRSAAFDKEKIDAVLRPLVDKGVVQKYSYITFPMQFKFNIETKAQYPSQANRPVYGIDENFFDTTFEHLVLISEKAEGGPSEYKDLFKYLDVNSEETPDSYPSLGPYIAEEESILSRFSRPSTVFSEQAEKGNGAVDEINVSRGLSGIPIHFLMATSGKPAKSFDTSLPMLLQGKLNARCTLMATKIPGFNFGSYDFTFSSSPFLVSKETFDTFNKIFYTGLETTYERIFVKVSTQSTARQEAISALRSAVEENVLLSDVESKKKSLQVLSNGLNAFSIVIALLADILSFAMLWTTFRSNVKENSWELAVQRAIGVTNGQLMRIYLYEALCLVLSALFLGTIVGILVAVTLVLQYQLLNETRFKLFFPWVNYVILVSIALFASVAAPFLVVRKILKVPIAKVLRSN